MLKILLIQHFNKASSKRSQISPITVSWVMGSAKGARNVKYAHNEEYEQKREITIMRNYQKWDFDMIWNHT